MKFRKYLSVLLFCILMLSGCGNYSDTIEIKSPDGKVEIEFHLNKGTLEYSLYYNGSSRDKNGLTQDITDIYI